MSILEIEGAGIAFRGLRALSDVDISVERGEILGIIGPNGAGKTTLFNVICGALRPDTGRIVFDGRDVTGLTPDRIARTAPAFSAVLRAESDSGRLSVFQSRQLALDQSLEVAERLLGVDKQRQRLDIFAVLIRVARSKWQDELKHPARSGEQLALGHRARTAVPGDRRDV